MLLLQALGLWHGVVHAHGHPGHGQHASSGAFSGHDEGDEQCRLYDQLAHADIAVGQAAAPAVLTQPGDEDAAVPTGRLAPQAAGFLARGPPAQA